MNKALILIVFFCSLGFCNKGSSDVTKTNNFHEEFQTKLKHVGVIDKTNLSNKEKSHINKIMLATEKYNNPAEKQEQETLLTYKGEAN